MVNRNTTIKIADWNSAGWLACPIFRTSSIVSAMSRSRISVLGHRPPCVKTYGLVHNAVIPNLDQ